MVRPKDPFWKHATDLKNGRFLCKFCDSHFAGGISRLKWHLSGLEGNDVKVCEQVPRDIQLAVLQVVETPHKRERQVNVSTKKRKDKQVEDENCSVLSSFGGPNLCMDNVLMGKKLAKLFFSFGIHPRIIVSPIFEDFVKSITKYGPSTYQLASAFTDEEEFVSEVNEEVDEYIENFIDDPVQAGCTLMVNISSDFQIRLVDTIFAYSQRGAACLKSFKDEPELEGIQKVVYSTIDDLGGPKHVVQVLLSRAENFKRKSCQTKYITREFLNIKKLHPHICVRFCAIGEINDFFLKMEMNLSRVIILLRFIVHTYHYYNESSRRGTERLEESSAFIFVMLKSILEIEEKLQDVPFSSIIESSDRVKLLDEKEKAKHFRCAKLFDYIFGRKEFWSRVKALAKVWFLLFQTRCLVNRENSSIGYLYQMIERLKDGIEKSREYDHFIYDSTWNEFDNMRVRIIHPIHAAAAFLDPAYMYTDNFEESVEMINGINYMFENMVDLNEKETFTKELLQYRMKMPELFTAQARTMLKTWHPRIWWDFCGKHTPVLRKYAIRILSQPCNTSFCMRYEVLKALQDDFRKDRSTRVNTMIVNENSRSPELEPIILDKLGEDQNNFTDVRELDHECFIHQLFPRLSSDREVDCMINYPSHSFWDDVDKTFSPFVQESSS